MSDIRLMKPVKIEGSRKLGTFIKPMTAQLSDQPAFDSTEWLFEIKWDGYRAIAELDDGAVRLYSRNGITFDKAYPKIFNALKTMHINAVLDGEIVVFDETGRPNFQRLQNYQPRDKAVIHYYVFDCLRIDDKNVDHLPLVDRKELLRELLPKSDCVKFCDHVEDEGKALFAEVRKMNFEGIIAKRKKSKYLIGRRTSDWLKIKNVNSREAVIIGFTAPKGARSHFGSLLIGEYQEGKLVSIGGVGTGFTEKSLAEIHTKLRKIVRKSSPLDVPIKQTPDMTWVDPVLVCNIKFTEITDEGSVRHPVFEGLRIDKDPRDVTGT